MSRFDNCMTPGDPQQVNLYEWLVGDEFKDMVMELRAVEDKPARDKLKRRLPAITPSGLFSYRDSEHLIQPTGIMCVDIDAKENKHIADFDELKQELSLIKNIAYCGLSASGKGLFCLIPVAYPDKHSRHFDSLKLDFLNMGIVIDRNCRDITRARSASYDPAPHINLNASIYRKLADPPKPKPIFQSYTNTGDQIGQTVSEICRTSTDLANDNYEAWFKIGCAIASELGEFGREMFHAVSSQSSIYNAADCDKQYNHCLRDRSGIGIGTFFYYCQINGINIKQL